MSVTLTWGAANAALAESINIYRSTTPLDVNNLPAALATAAGSATSYSDATAVRNTTYYYAVGHVRAGQELLSPVLIMGHYPDTGPGPQTLLRGNWDCGYFGLVPTANFLSISQLRALLNNPNLGNSTPADGTVTGWYKFIRKGKVLFIPNNVFAAGTCRWRDIYNNGLIYGTDDTGSAPFVLTTIAGITLTNQKVVVPYATYNFLVRAPSVTDAATNVYAPGVIATDASEWGSLMGRQGLTLYSTSPQDKWNDEVPPGGVGSATQHFSSGKLAISVSNSTGFDYNVPTDADYASGYANWRPVLELILT